MTNALRKAALTLAGLGKTDRAWLLERVQLPERKHIAELMKELGEMRVPLDAELLKGLALEPSAAVTGLAGADARAALRALRDEPDWLVSLVLRQRAWPWSDQFLRLVGADRRQRIRSASHDVGELRPKTVARLLAALDARVDAQAAESQSLPRKRPWREVLTWRR
jgi:hypothetical protein